MVLLCHFLNSEHILPWWIQHHKGIFEYVVMVDHGSTDRSVEIIRSLAPDWEIFKTGTHEFGAIITDQEMMQLEERFDGPKIILNVTEFLFGADIPGAVKEAQEAGYNGIITRGAIMVDPNMGAESYPEEFVPLIWSYPFGQFEDTLRTYMPLNPLRSRVLHWAKNGAYCPGRHVSNVPNLQRRNDVMTLWFHYSPVNSDTIRRHGNYFLRQPQGQAEWLGNIFNHFATDEDFDRAMLGGWHHIAPPYHFLRHYRMLHKLSMNLNSDPHFNAAFQKLYSGKWFEVLSRDGEGHANRT
jgi:glycosyltransferase involved in cell wall biosynthesis